MSPIVTASGVSFEFLNGRELFSNLNLSLSPRLSALVGPNGAGKTCLARLLAGEIAPTQGVIQRHCPIRFLPQRLRPSPITVAEFLLEYEWSPAGERLLQGIDRDALCTTLSGGQWMRVRLARALCDDFLILDEPTNDLDRDGRAAVIHFLKEHTGGALLISHDRECLKLCNEILELSNRGLAKFSGDWSAYAAASEKERARLVGALDTAKRARHSALADRAAQKSRQEKRAQRGAESAARGGMPKLLLGARKRNAQTTSGKLDSATMQRAEDTVREAYEAVTRVKTDSVMYADLVGREIPARKLIAEAHEFNVRFEDWIYRHDLDFTWRGNVRIALQGANGSGKSTLLSALLGEAFATRGELRRGELVTLHIDQHCSMLDDSKSIFDNVREVSAATDVDIRNGLARFLFAGETVFQAVKDLSGGERLRAALARGFLGTLLPELVVLDEPTNNLDMTNVSFLENVVNHFRGALIVVSHDDEFVEKCGVTHAFVLPGINSD